MKRDNIFKRKGSRDKDRFRYVDVLSLFCDDLLIALPGLKGVPLIKLKEPFEPLSTLVSCTSTQLHTINPFLLMIAHAQKQCFAHVKYIYTYCHFMVFDRCQGQARGIWTYHLKRAQYYEGPLFLRPYCGQTSEHTSYSKVSNKRYVHYLSNDTQ